MKIYLHTDLLKLPLVLAFFSLSFDEASAVGRDVENQMDQ